ncbi:HNH endonuclease [Halorussus salinisoli]|nr:HNH endonuclease [Halorussus salinisoli]
MRREALERDEHTCQNCGRTRVDTGRNPDVHHIERVRDFDKPEEAHTLKNVITLRRRCHRNVEAGNVSVSRPPDEK